MISVIFCLVFAAYYGFFGAYALKESNESYALSNESSWREELITHNYETLSICVRDVLSIRPVLNNLEFFPASIHIVTAMMVLKTLYYIDITSAEGSRDYQSLPDEQKSWHLEQARKMSELVRLLEHGANGTLKVNTVVFLLRPPTEPMKAYSEYMKKLFNSDVREATFTCARQTELIDSLKNWQSEKGKGYPRMWNDCLTPLYGITYTQACLITFVGCWDTSKFVEKSTNQGNFIHGDEIIQSTMLTAKAFVGYHHFTDLKVEALRLPYIGNKIAMLIVMPHQNESLDVLSSFNETEYRRIFERVSNTSEYVDLEIPFVDVSNIILNENGTVINIKERITCEFPPFYRNHKANVDYKTFRANRPFAMFLYHEESKSTFYSILLKYPISKLKRNK